MITTILQIFKRPQYLKVQLKAIKNQTIKSDKLIIVHNEGNLDIDFDIPPEAQLIYANPNMKFHLRFLVGLLVDTEYVSFLDDDSIPGNRWYENCIDTINKHDCICVTNGRDILEKERRQDCPGGWCNPNETEIKCWFGGHAWFLRKENLKYMWYDDVKEKENGEDIQLSANAWLYKRLPTYVPPHPLTDRTQWGSLKGMEFGADKVASYIVNPVHYEQRWKLIEYYLNKGWRPLD